MNAMPTRKGEAARFLGEEIANLERTVDFLQGELRKQCEQNRQRQKTIERQKATIDKLKKQLKARQALTTAKSMKTK